MTKTLRTTSVQGVQDDILHIGSFFSEFPWYSIYVTMPTYAWRVPLVCLVFYVIIEASWLLGMKTPFYTPAFADVQSLDGGPVVYDNLAAVLAYALILPVMYWFLVHPYTVSPSACGATSLGRCMLNGAALGLAMYGVYNLTNKATLRGYSWRLVCVDTCYGVTALVAVAIVARATARALPREPLRT